MRKSFLSWFLESNKGAIAPLYALALFALVGAAGIGFDYARLVSLDSELQNAADQAALAAATQLDKEAGAATRATAAATGGLVTNETLLANDGDATAIGVPSVRFYATRDEAQDDTDGTGGFDAAEAEADPDLDGSANFVRVQVEFRTVNYALTPIVGALPGTIDAKAVAGIGSALCRSPPVMICNPSEPAGNADVNYDFDADAYAGVGLLVVQGGGGSWAPGNFGYLDTGIANGAPGVRAALGWISPPGNCVSQNGDDVLVDTEPGNMASVPDALNTRFDIYNQTYCEAGGQCPASINSRKDSMHPTDFTDNQACKYGNVSKNWDQPASGRYNPTSATVPLATTITPTSMGHPRDICHVVTTGTANACTGPFGNALWDRDAYFRSHYVRTAAGNLGQAVGTRWTASEWQTNTGLGTSAKRYDVYLWEIENRGDTVDGVVVLGPTAGNPRNYGTPQCSNIGGRTYGTGTEPSDTVADRRRISVAVVNCRVEGVNGSAEDVPVRRWMDVFLVQPSAARGGGRGTAKDEIYAEIIGETLGGSSGETAGQVVRRDLPFLVK